MKNYTCSITWIVITKRLSNFIVYDMISSMESNWVADLGTQQCLEEITPFTCSIREIFV